MATCGELVRRTRRGDRKAFDELVGRHYPTVWSITRRFTESPEDADDLAQEAFVAAYERLHTLTQPGRFGAWVATIARNLGRMWLRRHAAQPALLPLGEGDSGSPSELANASLEAARESAGRQAIREAVAEALAALTPEHRQVCRLHYLLGYDYGETAALLEIPVAAVRGRLHRARGALRKEWHEMTAGSAQEWELGARDLDALRAAATFVSCSTESRHQSITAICLAEGGCVVATDLHRLFHCASPSLAGAPSVLIHADLGRALRDDHPQARRARLTLCRGEAVLRLDDGDEIRAPIVDAPFPDWEKVIPESWDMRASASARDWLDALALLARERDGRPVRGKPSPEALRVLMALSPQQGRIALRDGAEPPPGRGVSWEWSASFPARFQGSRTDLMIAANATYIEQAVRALGLAPNAQAELAANPAPVSPFLLRPAGNERIFVLTMPMQRPAHAADRKAAPAPP